MKKNNHDKLLLELYKKSHLTRNEQTIYKSIVFYSVMSRLKRQGLIDSNKLAEDSKTKVYFLTNLGKRYVELYLI